MRLRLATACVVIGTIGAVGLATSAHAANHRFTKALALKIISTGKGARPGTDLAEDPLPAKERPFALKLFRTGPYSSAAANFFYAFEATLVHYASTAQKRQLRKELNRLGQRGLIQRGIAKFTPADARFYDISAQRAAKAEVRGIITGLEY